MPPESNGQASLMNEPSAIPASLQARSCLVLGGARSGKSAFGQALAERSGRQAIYLATAAIWDGEMADRVALHRAARDSRWRTIEEQLDLVGALQREARGDTIVLVDCLTLWLTNLMLGEADADAEASRLVAAIADAPGPVIFVSNEVGAGIVPDNALARRFRDAQGRLNAAVARACDTVVLVTAGLPQLLKPSCMPDIDLR